MIDMGMSIYILIPFEQVADMYNSTGRSVKDVAPNHHAVFYIEHTIETKLQTSICVNIIAFLYLAMYILSSRDTLTPNRPPFST